MRDEAVRSAGGRESHVVPVGDASALAQLTELLDALPLHGSGARILDALRRHLPSAFGEDRVELGLLSEDRSRTTWHVLLGAETDEPHTVVAPAPGGLAFLPDEGSQTIEHLDTATDPALRRLGDAGYCERLVVPVTHGPSLVGILTVTTRGVIRPLTRQLARITAVALSARTHLLSATRPEDRASSLEAQLTELRLTTQAMERTDSLTRLPNRAAAFQAIGRARAQDEADGSFAFIDLDHLKMTNDRLGHYSGDGVLQGVADRLRDLTTTGRVTVFRMGGDEFGALSEGSPDELRTSLERVAHGLADRPVRIQGRDVPTSFSAGVYAIHGHGHGIEEIVSRAESAAREAKRSGRGRVLVHVPSTDGHLDTHSELRHVDAVRSAVLEGRMTMVAQPIQSVRDGVDSPMDAEVLVRLVGEDGVLLLPDDFVALAERYDVVNALDRAVLRRVVDTLRDGCLERKVSCNVSPHSMLDPTFVDWAEDLVRSSGQGDRMVVELTERLPIGSTAAVRAGMSHLGTTGVVFALDDFGAGTTSYGNLRDLPISVLKVDGVLVRGCLSSEVDHAMLRATLEVSRALGISAVAEGIETHDQLSAVVELGADAVQGYYFGQPRPWPDHAP